MWLSLAFCSLALQGVLGIKVFELPENRREDAVFWMEEGRRELDASLKRLSGIRGGGDALQNLRRPKNVIVFIGDGMSITTTTAARIYYGQKVKGESGEEANLIWDTFPETALLKTYNVDRQTPDSAGTATAYFTGVKTNFEVVGYDAKCKAGSPAAALKATKTTSILAWAQEIGKKTGVVTTTRLTHATPSALYAHAAHRDWECDFSMKRENGYGDWRSRPEGAPIALGEPDPDRSIHPDIATQLVKGDVGKKLNVALGGGLRHFKEIPGVVASQWKCARQDGVDLIQEWQNVHKSEGREAVFVNNTGQLQSVNYNSVDRLLGIFANSHLPYDHERDTSTDGQPSLSQMTTAALRVLSGGDDSGKGFVLAVEGGRIDHAHHANTANRALDETVAFDKAIRDTIDFLAEKSLTEDTLVIVTADHSHAFTMAGYPTRGADIRGSTGETTAEGLQESILSYADGQGAKTMRPSADPKVQGSCEMKDLDDDAMKDWEFKHPAILYRYDEHHGGDDVGLWATGPMAYLFHKNHEQNYVAHVVGYSLCMGPYKDEPECRSPRRPSGLKASSPRHILSNIVILLSFLTTLLPKFFQ